MAEIGVIYLCRWAEGDLPVRTFLKSYRTHPAGRDHDLHVVFKGFPSRQALETTRGLFAGLSVNAVELDDSGYDIGSYFNAAKIVSNRRLIFFNTFSELLVGDWLRKFDDALKMPEVGLVGATGSWQSHCSGYEAIIAHVWYWIRHPRQYWKAPASANRATDNSNIGDRASRYILNKFRRISRTLYHLIRLDKYVHYRREYGRYPNPHIRTNAFMIQRDLFLSFEGETFRSKSAVYKFESGRRSLTRRVSALGLKPVVIDRSGNAYQISDWKASATFWTNQQINLVVADNRTRDYAAGDRELCMRLEDNAWLPPSAWTLRGRRIPASR